MRGDTFWERADEEAHAASRDAAIAGAVPSAVPLDLKAENESCTEHLGNAVMLLECAELLSSDEQRAQALEDFKNRVRMALIAFNAGRYTPQSMRVGRCD